MRHARLIAALLFPMTITAAAIAATPTTRPARFVTTERIEQLIEQLGADDFKTRTAAASELRRIGRAALPSLKLTRPADPEVESWCASLAEQLDPKPRPAVAQLPAVDVRGFRALNGRLVEVQVELPVINRAARGEVQRLLQAKHRMELEQKLELIGKVEAEILDLRKKLEEPIDLRLNLRRGGEELAKPVEPAPQFEPAAKW